MLCVSASVEWCCGVWRAATRRFQMDAEAKNKHTLASVGYSFSCHLDVSTLVILEVRPPSHQSGSLVLFSAQCHWCMWVAFLKHLKIYGPRSARLTRVFLFQGSVLRGGPGWGEEHPQVSGYQVYPQEGFRRQGEQHWERDRSSTQVSHLTDYRL